MLCFVAYFKDRGISNTVRTGLRSVLISASKFSLYGIGSMLLIAFNNNMWLDLRKAGFHAHNSNTQFSSSNLHVN